MSQQPMGDIFKSSETVRDYDVMIGGVTRSLAEHILQKYLESDSLEGKVVLDNACGTGVVTKVILSQADNVKIEATDISEPMVDTLKASLASNPRAESVNAAVMDGQELTFDDDKFDLTVTLMGIMFMSDPERAIKHLYRVTKPGGQCYITSWHRMEHKEMAARILRRLRGESVNVAETFPLWTPQMEDPKYLPSALKKVGFKNTGGEVRPDQMVYRGQDVIHIGYEFLPKLYERMITLEEGEQEKWNQLWNEELGKAISSDTLTIPVWAIIAWGTK